MSAVQLVDVSAAARARQSRAQARLLWAGAGGLLSLVLTVVPFAASGTWSDLALGRVITAHGIPTTEPFSYLPAVHPWVAAGWLSDVLIAALVGAGGVTLASIALGLAASGGLVLAALSVRTSARVPAPCLAGAIVAGALVAHSSLIGGAPVLILGVGSVMYILARAREGEDRLLWLLPPVFLLWANLDSGFVAGLAIVFLAWALESRRRAAFRRTLLLTLGVCALAAAVNPSGVGLYQWIAAGAGGPATSTLSATFGSPDFHDNWLRLFELGAALLVIAWVAGGGLSRLDAVLGLAVIGLALWSAQFVSLFAVVAIPQLATYGWRAWDRAVAPRLPIFRRVHAPGGLTRALLPGLAMAAATLVAIAGISLQAGPRAAATSEASREPEAAATRVAEAFPGERVYAPSTWGDYLADRFPNGRVVFIYGPEGGFTAASVTTYATIHSILPGWETDVRDRGIRVAIVPDRSTEASGLHELGWGVECFDASSGAIVMTAPAAGAPSTPSSDLNEPPTNVAAC